MTITTVKFERLSVISSEAFEGVVAAIKSAVGRPEMMAKHVPDAGSYAPVTILVDERKDGVHLSYDRMAQSASHLWKCRRTCCSARPGFQNRETYSRVCRLMTSTLRRTIWASSMERSRSSLVVIAALASPLRNNLSRRERTSS